MNDQWFGSSADDLRDEFQECDAKEAIRRRKIIADHEAGGGTRPSCRPVLGDFVSTGDLHDIEVYDAYQAEEHASVASSNG